MHLRAASLGGCHVDCSASMAAATPFVSEWQAAKLC